MLFVLNFFYKYYINIQNRNKENNKKKKKILTQTNTKIGKIIGKEKKNQIIF